jgi:NIPSNAP
MKTTLCAVLSLTAVISQSSSPAVRPSMESGSRVFELRTYHTPPGKLEALHARFRDHTNALFKTHGMTVVGYWVPMDADKGSADTLVYMLAFPSRAAAQASWKAFGADPEWVRVKAESEKEGPLTTKVESVFLSATDYSPVK